MSQQQQSSPIITGSPAITDRRSVIAIATPPPRAAERPSNRDTTAELEAAAALLMHVSSTSAAAIAIRVGDRALPPRMFGARVRLNASAVSVGASASRAPITAAAAARGAVREFDLSFGVPQPVGVPAQRSHDPATSELDSAVAPAPLYTQPSAASLTSTVFATPLLSTATLPEHAEPLPWTAPIMETDAATTIINAPLAGVPSIVDYADDTSPLVFDNDFFERLGAIFGTANHAQQQQLSATDLALFSANPVPGDFGEFEPFGADEEVLLASGTVSLAPRYQAQQQQPPLPPAVVLRQSKEARKRSKKQRARKHKSRRVALQELTESEHDDSSDSSSDSDSSDEDYGKHQQRRRRTPAPASPAAKPCPPIDEPSLSDDGDSDSDDVDAPRAKNSAQKAKYETHTRFVYAVKSGQLMLERLERELALAQSRPEVRGYERDVRTLIAQCKRALAARKKVRALVNKPGVTAEQLNRMASEEGDFDGRRLNMLNKYNSLVPERTEAKAAVIAESRAKKRHHAQQQATE
jgi:hypothetical protein